MELVIYKQKTFLADDFIDYLYQIIQRLLLSSHIDFRLFNQYFANNFQTDINAQSILISATQNLVIQTYKEITAIQINENIFFKDSKIKLIDLCKLLNYGTLDIPGTGIFSDTFDYIATNINQIYLNYILEM